MKEITNEKSKEICYCKALYNLPDDVECLKDRCGRYRIEKRKKEQGNNILRQNNEDNEKTML